MRVAVAILVLMWCGFALADQASRVDRTFTAKGDLTGDGIPEILTIHITGTSLETPLKWAVTIADLNGTTIYRVERDDSWLDKFFNDKGYEIGCSDYVSCKERYYFHDIPKAIFASTKPSRRAWGLDEFKMSNLRNTVSTYLTQQGVSTETVRTAIGEMRTILQKPGFHVLEVPVSAVKSAAPMIWVPSVKAFVPYYQE